MLSRQDSKGTAMPKASEPGSITLSKFGGGAGQVYLVIRDLNSCPLNLTYLLIRALIK